jgi:anti-sigma regulatory factor (Ser/Thr protein kinase)
MRVGIADPAEETGMAEVPGPKSSVLRLPAEPSSVRHARDFVRDKSAAITESARDAVILMVSELVTNAVIHGLPPIVVMIHGAEWGVQVSVLDDRPDRPVLRPHSLDATGGRGMQVIDALATAWGVRSHPTGKAVWFILIDQ